MNEFEHIVLTRFNVREITDPPSIPSQAWHEARFKLFERFCYPSMFNQKNQDYKWLVFFDLLTPDAYKNKIGKYAKWGNFIPLLVDNFSLENIKIAVKKQLNKETKYLITSRIDNDDSVSTDFIDIIQNEFRKQKMEFININNGYIWHNDRIYLTKDKSNPFISLIEKINAGDFNTVWCRQHRSISEVGNLKQIKNNYAWIQVVHDNNVSNRVKGRRIKGSIIKENFGIDMSSFGQHDHEISFYLDLALLTAIRLMREIMIELIKKILRRK